jgi:hypothetical protein
MDESLKPPRFMHRPEHCQNQPTPDAPCRAYPSGNFPALHAGLWLCRVRREDDQ